MKPISLSKPVFAAPSSTSAAVSAELNPRPSDTYEIVRRVAAEGTVRALGGRTPEDDLRLVDADLSVDPSAIARAAELSDGARQFMRSVLKEEEPAPDANVRTRWCASKVVEHGPHTLVVMNLRTEVQFDGEWIGEAGSSFEVLSLVTKANGTRAFERFENAVPIPETLRVAIGSVSAEHTQQADGELVASDTLPSPLYYVELQGAHVAAALKSIYAKTPCAGFSADLAESASGKADFDPTPGRTWRVDNPAFDLRRGSTAEIYDVNAGHLDANYERAAAGAAHHVAPWNAAFIRRVLVDGEWRDVVAKPIA